MYQISSHNINHIGFYDFITNIGRKTQLKSCKIVKSLNTNNSQASFPNYFKFSQVLDNNIIFRCMIKKFPKNDDVINNAAINFWSILLIFSMDFKT